MGAQAEPLLALEGVAKRYGPVVAVAEANLALREGEIHALLGENGAGKSTLVKIVYGVTRPDAGAIRWRGRPVAPRSPAEARALGVGMVFQHFSLFETMTVAENVSLSMKEDARALEGRIRALGERLGLPIDPRAPVHALSVGERQRVEIVRCLLQDPQLLILDEPTAVLPPSAAQALFDILRRLAAEGRAILFISHKLEEIRALCGRATVMRRGRVVAEVDPAATSAEALARAMIGADPPPPRRRPRAVGAEPALAVEGLTLPAPDRFGVALDDVTLAVRPGEVVGVAGVSGNGQAELARVLSGETRLPKAQAWRIRIGSVEAGAAGPAERRRLGLAFAPEERLGRAAVPPMSLVENGILTAPPEAVSRFGFLRPAAARAIAEGVVARFDVRARGPDAPARSLSGGNLQKFVVGREIAARPRAIVLSQPTWGVDVGAAAAVRQAILDLVADGAAALVISDELDELLEIADRVHVIFRGRLSGPAAPDARAAIGLAMAGRFDALARARGEEPGFVGEAADA